MILFIILIYVFLFYSLFSKSLKIVRASIYLCIFLMLKWIFNYRKCTFGYLECKIRNVKREKGIINNFCEYYGDMIYSEYNYYLFTLLILTHIIQLVKLIFIFNF